MEALRAAFEKVNAQARDAVERGKPDSELSRTVQTAWESMFHQSLSAPALKGMVAHYRTVYRARKTRKAGRVPYGHQRGGMAAYNSAFDTAQGTTQPVYGSFPLEMGQTPQGQRGLDFVNRFFESSMARSCDSTGGAPAPGQRGGGMFDAFAMGHAPNSVPQNGVASLVSTIQGAPARDAPAAPEIPAWSMQSYTPQAFNSSQLTSISALAPVYNV